MRIAYLEQFSRVHHELPKVEALRSLGHEVIPLEEKSILGPEQVFKVEPDIILFTKLRINLITRVLLLKEAKRRGIKTVCWIPDLYFGLGRQRHITLYKDVMFDADLVLTPDGGHDQQWVDANIHHKVLRQSMAKEFYYRGGEMETPPIVFVGCKNNEWIYRNKLLTFLEKTYGKQFKWYGKFNTEEIRGRRLNDLYNSAKIVIGDSVFSPRYWSNRIYETLGRGGFLIHPMVEGLEKEYTPYKEFIPYHYNDFACLKEKIDHFLAHDSEREAIRQAGFERTKNYLLEERCKTFLSLVQ